MKWTQPRVPYSLIQNIYPTPTPLKNAGSQGSSWEVLRVLLNWYVYWSSIITQWTRSLTSWHRATHEGLPQILRVGDTWDVQNSDEGNSPKPKEVLMTLNSPPINHSRGPYPVANRHPLGLHIEQLQNTRQEFKGEIKNCISLLVAKVNKTHNMKQYLIQTNSIGKDILGSGRHSFTRKKVFS